MKGIFTPALFLFLFFSWITEAQQKQATIAGKILDAGSQQPLPFATISVFRLDSTLLTGGVAAADGSFNVLVTPGNYYATIQMISYEPVNIPLRLAAGQVRQLGTISLSANTKTLEEVVVQGERNQMHLELDKRVFNVDQDLSNVGRTAADILDNIPSITVDPDGNVSLRGSQDVKILIDGKPSGLVGINGTSGLSSLQGDMIEKVEVITNPSARYEAEGMAGIINIVLKKENKKGVNGSARLVTGLPKSLGASANMNFRREKLNYFVNYDIHYHRRPGGGYNDSRFILPDSTYSTYTNRDQSRGGLSNSLRGGIDWNLTDNSTLTGTMLVDIDHDKNYTDLTYNDYNSLDELNDISLRSETEHDNEQNYEASLNYEQRFDSNDDHNWTTYLQLRDDDEIEDSNQKQSVTYSSSLTTDPDILQRSYNDEHEQHFLLQSDYSYPFGDKGKFEAGGRSTLRSVSNDYDVDQLDPENGWLPLPNFVNHFIYNENINALYALVGNRIGKISYEAGVRMEATNIDTELKETNEKSSKSYVDWFPSVHMNYYLNDNNSIQVSYTRRLSRPRFHWLNPFSSYTDSRNLRTGNPDLNPEYTDSYEAGYLLNNRSVSFYGGAYYRYTNQVIQGVNFVEQLNDNGTLNTYTVHKPVNLSTENSYGLEGNISEDVAYWWNFSTNFNFFRAITEGTFEGTDLSRDTYTWNMRATSRMKFWRRANFQLSYFYRAPHTTTQGRRKAFYGIDCAVSKDVLQGKGTVVFSVRDLLNSRKWRYVNEGPDFYTEGEFQWASRRATLSFVLRINQKKKPNMGNDEQNGNEGGMDIGGSDF